MRTWLIFHKMDAIGCQKSNLFVVFGRNLSRFLWKTKVQKFLQLSQTLCCANALDMRATFTMFVRHRFRLHKLTLKLFAQATGPGLNFKCCRNWFHAQYCISMNFCRVWIMNSSYLRLNRQFVFRDVFVQSVCA